MKIKVTKFDVLLVIVVLGISVFSLFNSYNKINDTNKKTVLIYLEGKLYKQFTLTDDLNKEIEVKGDKYENTIEIENGNVTVTHSTCPDHICERHTSINSPGQIIVCLPNEMIVEIKGEEDSDSLDSLSQ